MTHECALCIAEDESLLAGERAERRHALYTELMEIVYRVQHRGRFLWWRRHWLESESQRFDEIVEKINSLVRAEHQSDDGNQSDVHDEGQR
jgi:hypothetical protein